MAQLQQFVDKAADPVILSEIDAANNTINELVEQLNQPQAGGKRKSRKKRKTRTRKQREGKQRGGWMYKESASSNYSNRIPYNKVLSSNKITSERILSSQISSKGKGKGKSSSSKDNSSGSKTRKGKK